MGISDFSTGYPAVQPGNELFLTPYIKEGRIIAARQASKVPSLIEGNDVESYAGYLTVNSVYNSNLFFWFFPAENNPSKAPVALWLQGGPGGSSLFGTFAENGPFSITKDLKLARRSHYWSQQLNMIYIDNPVGTGFSFTDIDIGYATNEAEVGTDLYAALVQFFQLFPEYQSHDFFITGESYAGKYIPALGHTIHKNNPGAQVRINLVGMAIGDGWIDPRNMMVYSDYLFQHGLIDDNTTAAMKMLEQQTVQLIDEKKFHEAAIVNDKIMELMVNVSGPIDQYDFLEAGNDPDMAMDIAGYLDQTYVRKSLHVGKRNFSEGGKVAEYLYDDVPQSVAPWLGELLDEYRVLLYNGQLDIIVAYPLTVNFIKNLNWTGTQEYLTAPRKLWWVGNELAGYTKSAKNLTEILVRNAGHMVPANQPIWALDLITRFTQHIPFDRPFAA